MVSVVTFSKFPLVVITMRSLLTASSSLSHDTLGAGMDSPVHDRDIVVSSISVVFLEKVLSNEGRAAIKMDKN